MREQHPVFDTDVPPDAVLWRYMDFAKFVSMLAHKALWFSRADLLGDPLEGSLTKADLAKRTEMLETLPSAFAEAMRLRQLIEVNQRASTLTYVNCWHEGEHESMALWQGYGGGPYGVAVKTTFGLLDDHMPEELAIAFPNPIYLGRVRYIDHSSGTDVLPLAGNMYAPFACKSVVYKQEQEVRAVYMHLVDTPDNSWPSNPPGITVAVDLARLVTAIVVSPLAPAWFSDLVADVVKQYGFEFPMQKSLRSSEPIY